MSDNPLKSFEDTQSTMILMMLYPLSNMTAVDRLDVIEREVKGERAAVKRFVNQGDVLNFKPTRPMSAYTFDATDNERVFATDTSYLLRHPAETLGDRSEVIMTFDGGKLRWMCFVRREKPKSILCAEPIYAFYEYHCMEGDVNGWRDYEIRPVAFNKKGRQLMMKVSGLHGHTGKDATSAIVAASIIEDARRSGAVLATLEAEASITFPVSLEDYKQFLSARDGYRNTPSGRRNSILHFCAEHERKRGEKTSEVRAHARGARVFETGGMKLTLTPPPEWEC